MTSSNTSNMTGLGLVTIQRDEPEASEGREVTLRDEHIAQLSQQVANLQGEIERLRNLTNLSISLNTPLPEERTNAHIPPSFPSFDSPIPEHLPPNPPLHNYKPTSTNAHANPQQANPSTFNTSYVSQPLLAQSTPLTQNHHVTQHLPMAHVAIPNMQHVPSVYAVEAQPFTTPMPHQLHPEMYQYQEAEKEVRDKADEYMAKEIRELKEAFKSLKTIRSMEGLEYEDLCVHPDVDLLAGYKVPKFDMFDRKGNPRAHLRLYCDKLVGVEKDEAIMMKLFIRSLTREALDWYTSQDPKKWRNWRVMAQEFMDRFRFNTETNPDRFYLMTLKKKTTESFREYAMIWRAEAARVQPPMGEDEMTTNFIRSQTDATYYERLISMLGQKFSEVVRMRDVIEEGLKSRKITNLAALQAMSKAIQSGTIGGASKKKEKEVSAVMTIQDRRPNQILTDQNPLPQPSYYSPYTQTPQPYYQPSPIPYPVYNAQPNYYPPRAPTHLNPSYYQPTYPSQPRYQSQNRPNAPRPRPSFERKLAKTYTPLAEPLAQLYERLKAARVLQPVPGRVPNPLPEWYDGTKHCAYHSSVTRHDTKNCLTLKYKIEELIKAGTIQLKGAPLNVNNNPLPNHDDTGINMISTDEDWNLEGTIVPIEDEKKAVSSTFIAPVITVQVRAPIEVEVLPPKPKIMALVAHTPSFRTKVVPWDYQSDVRNKGKVKLVVEVVAAGMTRSGWCYVPEEASREASSKDNNQKKSVTEAEAEEFWRKMQCSGYSVVDQLKKTPAQISLMSLLMSSDSHRNALVKLLNEAYVLAETTSEHLETMVAQILKAHKISFHEDELPPEGLSHNKALHLTVKCRDKCVSRVLIDICSALNMCPISNLKALGTAIGKVRESRVNIRAFDGAQRSAIGEIDLALQIGPVEFVIEFQVLDISATYNLLLGRSWIHMAGAVPSTLHQNVKFVWNHQEVVIHGEANNLIYLRNSIPIIESVERLDGATFHIEEIVTITRGKEIKLPSVFVIVASEMLKNGFDLGRGLGASKQINKDADTVNVTCNEISEQNNKQDLEEYEEDVPPAELTKELEQFENKSKPNSDETELINLGNSKSIKETRINVHLTPSKKEKYVDLLREYVDSFVDCFAGYHQILMDDDDVEKIAFITPWGLYCYRVMPFGLKNAGVIYMRAMTTIFHDLIHKEIEVYMDDVIIKSRKSSDHLVDLKKFFDRLRRYNLKLNPAKCAFGVPARKLLGFIISRRGVELDPSKIKAIQDLPPPKNRKDVMSFLGLLNYISRFIAQSIVICEPIFKILRKHATTKWTEECQ
ncbi:uncharacterized protein LOC142181560 [Nicotiana tabacum]|uniref:Uncharacterized protein LOC142181560 n=1 Tax=Nicotiana tabacum TaxID=4097 RepID=A0AC58UM57_TOBAC